METYKRNAVIYFHEPHGDVQHKVRRNVYYNETRSRLVVEYYGKRVDVGTTSKGRFIFPIGTNYKGE